jgi:hypothetical protein
MVLRIFGPKRGKVAGKWRKLHNEELYFSPKTVRVIKSRIMRLVGHVAGRGGGACRVWVGKPEGKRPLGRPRHR